MLSILIFLPRLLVKVVKLACIIHYIMGSFVICASENILERPIKNGFPMAYLTEGNYIR